jgi:hypothetical protein
MYLPIPQSILTTRCNSSLSYKEWSVCLHIWQVYLFTMHYAPRESGRKVGLQKEITKAIMFFWISIHIY